MDIAIQDSNAALFRYTPPTVNRDRCELLSQEIATLAGQLNAANHRFLILIAEFDERGGWAAEGAQSCAHWLNFKCGIDLGAAREKLRVAHARSALPKIAAAMQYPAGTANESIMARASTCCYSAPAGRRRREQRERCLSIVFGHRHVCSTSIVQ